jgi:hypothetical protein
MSGAKLMPRSAAAPAATPDVGRSHRTARRHGAGSGSDARRRPEGRDHPWPRAAPDPPRKADAIPPEAQPTPTRLAQRLALALELGGRSVQRLGAAGTTVTFWVTDAEQESITILLDRRPPQIVDGGEPSEVTIYLTRDDADAFARGQLAMPNALLVGKASWRGPVRKYLAVDPILRALLRRVDRPEGDTPPTVTDDGDAARS